MQLYNPQDVINGWFDLAENNFFADWLYGDWDEDKYKMYLALNEVPGVNRYMDYLLSRRADKEYLTNRGLSYSDIHDPRKLSTRNTPMYSTLTFVSRNLDKLYE